ncbi:Gx transporter family protein [Fundicoccus culcitae]|uniref:Gx transporter family protein n=1 Tax=Fundicoccus culcitae TaxID=2969821 RepID=A0ABY5P5F6_9LACT|nr:Gx transporter family protein [Fundicoccus culcitae]UUX33942.1 Gx transporter family protein [Fundicoccus culcitae]
MGVKSSNRMMVYIATLAAQAVIIGLLERFIPSPFSFAPGAKLGLSNLISVIAIFTLPFKYSIQVVLLKFILTALLGGTLSTFIYSFAGGMLSYFMMLLTKQLGPKRVSVIGISILGGVMHNVGQLSAAALMARSWSVLNYLPVLSISGILAGFAVGIGGNYLLNRISILRVYHTELSLSQKQESWLNQELEPNEK